MWQRDETRPMTLHKLLVGLVAAGLLFLVLGSLVRLTELAGFTGAVATVVLVALVLLAVIVVGERRSRHPRTPYW